MGGELAGRLRDLTLAIYERGARYAETKGIIIADTKFEFGSCGGRTGSGRRSAHTGFLAVLARRYDTAPGGPQHSYDKQYVRDYLESIRWNKQPPAPALPDEVAARTSEKYIQAYRALTGAEL